MASPELVATRSAPQLSAYIACSLDGFIATSDGRLDWLMAAAGDGEDYGYDAFMSSVDALAMGRGTYDFIADVDPWPFEGKQVFVFTHRPPAPRHGVTFMAESPSEAAERWASDAYERVYVDGGQLVSSFLAEGLIDDMTITMVPILLGEGIRLFHPGGRETLLILLEANSHPSGMLTLKYATQGRDAKAS